MIYTLCVENCQLQLPPNCWETVLLCEKISLTQDLRVQQTYTAAAVVVAGLYFHFLTFNQSWFIYGVKYFKYLIFSKPSLTLQAKHIQDKQIYYTKTLKPYFCCHECWSSQSFTTWSFYPFLICVPSLIRLFSSFFIPADAEENWTLSFRGKKYSNFITKRDFIHIRLNIIVRVPEGQ